MIGFNEKKSRMFPRMNIYPRLLSLSLLRTCYILELKVDSGQSLHKLGAYRSEQHCSYTLRKA